MHSEAQKVLAEFQKRIPESVAPHIHQLILAQPWPLAECRAASGYGRCGVLG